MEVPRNQVRQHVQRRPAHCYQGLLQPVPVHPLEPSRRRRRRREGCNHLRTITVVGLGEEEKISTNCLARRERAIAQGNPVPRTGVRLWQEEQHLQAALLPQGHIPNPDVHHCEYSLIVHSLGGGGGGDDKETLPPRTVYSMETVQSSKKEITGKDIIRQKSLYMDGTIYFLHLKKHEILAFDVDDETVRTIDMPGERQEDDATHWLL